MRIARYVADGGDPAFGIVELAEDGAGHPDSIAAIIERARQRFGIAAARVIHRVGLLQPLDQIVLVAVTSAHRGASFAACEFIMDYLKSEAPFWKKELTPQGTRWVDARVSDEMALKRWEQL